MRKLILAASLAALAIPAAPAFADPPPWAPAHGRRAKEAHRYEPPRRESRYDRRGYYVEPQPIRTDERLWRGNDGQYHCRRSNGTTGLVIGGAAGALLGREIDGGRDRTTGTILGAAAGALLGREVDRSNLRCR